MFRRPRAWLVVTAIAVAAFFASSDPLASDGLPGQQSAPNFPTDIPGPAKAMLENAEDFELLYLSPRPLDPQAAQDAAGRTFHHFKVLGSTHVQGAATRGKLVAALEKGVAEGSWKTMALCFNPRHGIQVTSKKKYADFVICFECRRLEMSGAGSGTLPTSASPQSVFNRVLLEAKVPLSSQ